MNPPGKMQIATHIDPLIVAPCVPQIAELDAKLWIQESSAEVFAFNDHLSCPMHVWGFGKKLKSVGTDKCRSLKGRRGKGRERPAFELNEQSIISTRRGTPSPNFWYK